MTAVVTGLGIVAPTGVTVEQYWANTLAGKSAIRPIERFDASGYPTKLAGEITDFKPTDHLSSRMIVQTDRWTQLALYATSAALRDAEMDPAQTKIDEYEMAVVTASSSAGNEFGQHELGRLWSKGPEHVTAYQSIAWFYAATTGEISISFGMRGPCGVLVTEQAGGLDALAQARRVLETEARLVVSGGTEAPLSPYAVVCQQSTGMLSTAEDPRHAYLPFDRNANGYVLGEGGAILILEEEHSARSRCAPRIYGALLGCASTFDPPPGSDREPTLRRAAELALADAGVDPADIDVVFADAAGVRELDRREATVIRDLFGTNGVPVTAPKTMTGRLSSGAGALDVATSLLSIRDGIIPPSTGTRPIQEYGLDLVVDEPRTADVHLALVLARGFGGFNSAAVVGSV